MANVFFFDTETNGLPKNFKASPKDVNNWPRIIQFAYQVGCTETKEVFKKGNILIKPEGWTIPKEKFWIDNGFSTEQSIEKGVSMNSTLDIILSIMEECDIIAAHNLDFDKPVLIAEMFRYNNIYKGRSLINICTMKSSTDFCKIPSRNRFGFKWPTLTELHKTLFKEGFEGAHDADIDTTAGINCFFKLLELGVIKL